MDELWKPVAGWIGWYEVSSLGRVRSVERVSHRADGTLQTWRGRALTPYANQKGYYCVRLSRPGLRRVERLHRIVGFAFLPEAHTTETINHKDGTKSHNAVENLEWATRSENTAHSIANGLGEYIPPWHKKRLLPSSPDETASGISRADLNTPDPRVGELIEKARNLEYLLKEMLSFTPGQWMAIYPRLAALRTCLNAFGE